ncbi:MAG: error-prone DNA polymerase [Stagnimonas sp.]|nr:error-prone DNA polymerase [Stagnimonas sp.]
MSRSPEAPEAPEMDLATEVLAVAPGTPDYAELHCISNFSFLRGGSSPQELVAQAQALRYSALAITDECSLAGIVRAWEQAKLQPIHLIFGTTLQLSDGPRLLLLAENREGYARISAAITRARLNTTKGSYRLSSLDFHRDWHDVSAIWLPGTVPDPREAAWVQERFGYGWIAIERHLDGDDGARIDHLLKLGRQYGLRPVACGDVHYHSPDRRRLQDVLTALRLKTSVDRCGQALLANGQRHLRRREEIAALYDPAWIAETLLIARRCNFQLEELRYEYPKALTPQGITPTDHLRKLTGEGMARRWPQGCPHKVRAQIERELELIAYKQYEAFFLTVEDIVRYARSQDILCQGRGSAANSAVCYALGITEVNPELTDLLFERFVSRERDEAPDIDVDFEHQRREEVIQYIYRKYGRQHAALAATVIHYRSRLALRDVGRALGVAPETIDRFGTALAWWDGTEKWEERLAELGIDPRSAQFRLWLSLARQLQGFPRHLSQHVGGFVISERPVHELVPMENAAMKDRSIIEWDKDDLESLGLLKVDVLALGMLSALRRMLSSVSRREGRTFALSDIPREDAATYQMIRDAKTVGVFQIESRAQMAMLPRLRPENFYDLVIQIAIVRPGPIEGGMVHPYLKARARRRQEPGWEPQYYGKLQPALERTLGIPIFQEQVMQIVSIAADFTPGEADHVRRSMAAWKRSGGLEKFEGKLKQGMAANGYPSDFADSIYKMILGFGSYGFPESHSASFAILAYASSWLKCHQPAAFIAGLLDSQPMGFYPPTMLVSEAKKMGVTMLPVSVIDSDWDSRLHWQRPEDESDRGALRLGFNRICGFNEAAAQRIMVTRAQRPFRDAADLAARARLSRHELDLLARADALQALAGHRNQARWLSLGYTPQTDLLAAVPRQEAQLSLPMPSEGAEIISDYRSVGLSLRKHPVALLRPKLDKLRVTPNEKLAQLRHGQLLRVAGLTMFRQRPPEAKGVMFMTLEDETGIVNLVVWAKVLDAHREAAVTGGFLIIGGEVQRQDNVTHVIAKRIRDYSHWVEGLPYLSRDFR